MICVKFAAFCDLRFRLATLRKSVRKFWFCKLVLTCESVWPAALGKDMKNLRLITCLNR